MLGMRLNIPDSSGKMSDSLTNIIQDPKEALMDFFLQRLTSAVNKIASDPEVRQILFESVT